MGGWERWVLARKEEHLRGRLCHWTVVGRGPQAGLVRRSRVWVEVKWGEFYAKGYECHCLGRMTLKEERERRRRTVLFGPPAHTGHAEEAVES